MALFRHKKEDDCEPIKDVIPNQIISHGGTVNNQCTVNNNNTTNNNNMHVNIHINAFGQENVEHITTEFAKACLELGVFGVIPMLDKIYFNKEHPENFNVKLQSMKNSLVEVKTKDEWQPQGLYGTVDRMLDNSGNHIICKATPGLSHVDLASDKIVGQIDSIKNIKPEAKRKLREHTKARLVQRRNETTS